MNIEDITNRDDFSSITANAINTIGPLLSNVSLPMGPGGQVDPSYLAQVTVNQRILDVVMKVEIHKLTCMILYCAANPYPSMEATMEELASSRDKWVQNLCKHLHTEVQKFVQDIVQSLQESKQAKQTRLVLPGQKPPVIRLR